MSAWVDFFLYSAFTVMFWGSIPASRRFTVPAIVDRDPEWLGRHPEIERRFAGSRWLHRSCRAWAALSVAILLAVQVGLWPGLSGADSSRWEALKDVNSALLIAGLIYVFSCMLVFERWLRASVPLAARRQAPLVRRSVDDHVPRPVQLAVYGIVTLHLAAWLLAGVAGQHASAEFWSMLAFQYAIAGVLLLVVLVSVRRRPNAMDRIFGQSYRRLEVRLAFASQVAPLMNGAARLYEQTGGATPETLNRLLHLGLVAFVGMLAAAVTIWSRHPADNPPSRSSRTLGSLAGLVLIGLMTTAAASTQDHGTPPPDEQIRAL